MRIYNTNTGGWGCLLGFVLLIVLLYFFAKVLFFTPIGWALLVTAGIWYLVKRWQLKKAGVDMGSSTQTTYQNKETANPFEKESTFNKQEAVEVTKYEDVVEATQSENIKEE